MKAHSLSRLAAPAVAWWQSRTAREQRTLKLGALVITAVLTWSAGLKPALDSIAQSRAQLTRLKADATTIQALALEAAALQRRQSGRMDAAAIPEALLNSLRRSGLGHTATLDAGHRAAQAAVPEWAIHLSEAGAIAVMSWLASVPQHLHLRIKSVELSRSRVEGRDRPGHVAGRIVVQATTEAGT